MPVVPSLEAATPRIIPLSTNMLASHNIMLFQGHPTYVLDGLVSTDSLFGASKGITFIYGGGAYNLRGSTIAGNVDLQLQGAAANTARLLAEFGLLTPAGQRVAVPDTTPVVPANTPITKKAVLKKPLKGDISQYDGAQPPQ